MIHHAGTGCLIFKRDLKAAYRQIPIDPGDYKYLGYSWNGQFYFDTRLAMGQRTSALACQRSTRPVAYIMNSQGYCITVYLDDFIGVEPPCRAWQSYYALKDILSDLGLEENFPKAHAPDQIQEVLGILIDTRNMTMSVTSGRLSEIKLLISDWLQRKSATKRQMQSLLGKLMYISKCVRQSRIFVNRILSVMRKLKQPFYKVKLSAEFRKDLLWWDEFLVIFNGVSIIPDVMWKAPDAIISTDACLTGCGGVSADSYFRSPFPDSILHQNLSIHELEMLAIVVAVKVWRRDLPGQRLLIYCDNEASVWALNSGRTVGSFTASCLREIWFYACSVQLEIRGVHLPGVENRKADYLSRSHINRKYFDLFLDECDKVYTEIYIDESHFTLNDRF